MACERLADEEALRLLGHLRKLQSIYEIHIAVEDNEIFPLAARVLDPEALNNVGREMAKRRGQKFESPLVSQHR